jgi:hypothetical protein
MTRAKTILVLVAALLVVLLLGAGWLVYDFFFIPHFDEADLRQSLDTIQKKYAFESLSVGRVRAAARQHSGAASFCIPITPRYELLVFRVTRWSEIRGYYDQWRLYPEPLYTEEYVAKSAETGVQLQPIDYCRHHLSEYLRSKQPFDEDLVWQWPDTTVEHPDGTHSISIGMSAIAGSGVGVTVKRSGELVGYEELFSPD